MEITYLNKENLTKDQADFVRLCLRELWDIEAPFLEDFILADIGPPERAQADAYESLGGVFLAKVGGEYVGILAYQGAYSTYIDKIHILEQHRGKGYGRCLVNAFQLEIDTVIRVIVTTGNDKSHAFYKGIGFYLLPQLDYYQDVDDQVFTYTQGSRNAARHPLYSSLIVTSPPAVPYQLP